MTARASSILVAILAVPLFAACGKVMIDDTSGGSGGSVATTSGTTMTTATGGTGGGPTICGGEAGAPCGPDQWCDFDESAACGGSDDTGICQPKPQGCDDDCPGVCGCDGKIYCNACTAQVAGFDVSPTLTCTDDVYAALNMFTGAARYAIVKSSISRSLCFRLVVMQSGGPGTGISGDGWSVQSIEVTNDAHDCTFMPGWPPIANGDSFSSSKGDGTLSLLMTPAGCVTGIHGTADFTGAPPWAPPQEGFDMDGMNIEGGCP